MIDQNKLFDDFWNLTYTQRRQILKDIFGWSEQKSKEYEEDFGWNMSGIILRNLKEKALTKDFRPIKASCNCLGLDCRLDKF